MTQDKIRAALYALRMAQTELTLGADATRGVHALASRRLRAVATNLQSYIDTLDKEVTELSKLSPK